MKIKNIVSALFILLAVTALQSCYKDDDKLFDQSSSKRMEMALDEARQMLISSEYGWVFEMYPSNSQKYGGTAYTVLFDKEFVTVGSEKAKPSDTVTSLWKMTNDSGPVLTFDSYNKFIHEYSTPSQTAYQAKEGEFEFLVLKVEKDVITLQGKKTGNVMYLYRLNEPAEEYLTKIQQLNDKLILSGIKGSLNGKEVEARIDLDNRQMSFNVDGESVDASAYCLTSTGVRMYKDVEIAGAKVKDFTVNFDENGTTQNFYSESTKTAFDAQFPEGWVSADTFIGNFEFSFLKTSTDTQTTQLPVTITPEGDGTTFWLSGLSDNFDIKLTYNKSLGVMNMVAQYIYEKDHKTLARVEVSGTKYYLAMIPFALPKGASSGSVGYSTEYGMCTKYTGDGVFEWIDNDKWSGKKTTCFRLYLFTGTSMSSTTRNTSSIPTAWRFYQSSSTLYYQDRLIKVNE